jgi:hypothetical protein
VGSQTVSNDWFDGRVETDEIAEEFPLLTLAARY